MTTSKLAVWLERQLQVKLLA